MTAKSTAQMWPEETADELIARIRREHGDAIADIVLADLAVAHARKKPVPTRVGAKPVKRAGLSKNLIPKRGVNWRELHGLAGDEPEPDDGFVPGVDGFGKRLPRSGAGPIVRVVPRAQTRRRGLNDS